MMSPEDIYFLQARLQETGIGFSALALLLHVADEHVGVCGKLWHLAAELQLTTAGVSWLLGKCEKAGLVEIKRSELDRRRRVVTVTERGFNLLKDITGISFS